MRFLLAVAALLIGCQDHPVEPTHTKVAWDSDVSGVIVADEIPSNLVRATLPGTLWMIYYYPDGLPPFVCRQEGGWRGFIEIRVTPDSIYHPVDAERFENPDCLVEWSGNFQIDGLAPTEGRVRLESVHLAPSATSKETIT